MQYTFNAITTSGNHFTLNISSKPLCFAKVFVILQRNIVILIRATFETTLPLVTILMHFFVNVERILCSLLVTNLDKSFSFYKFPHFTSFAIKHLYNTPENLHILFWTDPYIGQCMRKNVEPITLDFVPKWNQSTEKNFWLFFAKWILQVGQPRRTTTYLYSKYHLTSTYKKYTFYKTEMIARCK